MIFPNLIYHNSLNYMQTFHTIRFLQPNQILKYSSYCFELQLTYGWHLESKLVNNLYIYICITLFKELLQIPEKYTKN